MKLSQILTKVAEDWFNGPRNSLEYCNGLCYLAHITTFSDDEYRGLSRTAYYDVGKIIRKSFEPDLDEYLEDLPTPSNWDARAYFALFLVEWLKDNPEFDKDYE